MHSLGWSRSPRAALLRTGRYGCNSKTRPTRCGKWANQLAARSPIKRGAKPSCAETTDRWNRNGSALHRHLQAHAGHAPLGAAKVGSRDGWARDARERRRVQIRHALVPVDLGDDGFTPNKRPATDDELPGDDLAQGHADGAAAPTERTDERDLIGRERRHGIAPAHQLMEFGYEIKLMFQRIDVVRGHEHVTGEQQVGAGLPHAVLAVGQLALKDKGVKHGGTRYALDPMSHRTLATGAHLYGAPRCRGKRVPAARGRGAGRAIDLCKGNYRVGCDL